MAAKKGGLDSVKASIGGLLSRVPFLKVGASASPEPFSSIEDETPLGDLLSAKNAAPGAPAKKGGRELPDVRALARSAVQRRPVLIGIVVVSALLLLIVVVAVAVTIPPKAPVAKPAFSREGLALVKTWLPPPGDPLEPRMEMEREGPANYSAADAARLGAPSDPRLVDALAEKNDRAIEDLYGTVP